LQAEPAAFDVEAIRRDFPALHQDVHGRSLVYLDTAATALKPDSVIDAVVRMSVLPSALSRATSSR